MLRGRAITAHTRELVQTPDGTTEVPLAPPNTATTSGIQACVDPPHDELVPLDISASSSRGQPRVLGHSVIPYTWLLGNQKGCCWHLLRWSWRQRPHASREECVTYHGVGSVAQRFRIATGANRVYPRLQQLLRGTTEDPSFVGFRPNTFSGRREPGRESNPLSRRLAPAKRGIPGCYAMPSMPRWAFILASPQILQCLDPPGNLTQQHPWLEKKAMRCADSLACR